MIKIYPSHKEAFIHAKEAAKIATDLIYDSLIISYHLYAAIKEAEDVPDKKEENTSFRGYTGTQPSPNFRYTNTPFEAFVQMPGKMTSSNSKNNLNVSSSFQTTTQTPTSRINKRANIEALKNQKGYLENIIPILEDMVPRLKGQHIFDRDMSAYAQSEKHQILIALREMLVNEEFKKPDMMDLYKDLESTHLLYTVNIMGIAQLQPLDPFQFKDEPHIIDSIQADNIIEQVILLFHYFSLLGINLHNHPITTCSWKN